MKLLRLVPFGSVELSLLERLRFPLSRELATTCTIDFRAADPSVAFHPERQQYHSTELIAELDGRDLAGSFVLGVAAVDLYIPILSFVFGEAVMGGRTAIISTHRLRQEFYGLPADEELVFQRLLKEAVHEVGHNLSLVHCDDYTCVMSSSHSVERIDLKSPSFCAACRTAAFSSSVH
jgi:archaemetzincin